MKHCTRCAFHTKEPTQLGNGQMVMVDFCSHPENSNPVDASMLQCGQARSNADFCGLSGRRWKEKELTKPKEAQGQVIQLA